MTDVRYCFYFKPYYVLNLGIQKTKKLIRHGNLSMHFQNECIFKISQNIFLYCILILSGFLTSYPGNGNFSIRFWIQYVSLFTSIAAIVSLLLTSDRKVPAVYERKHTLKQVLKKGNVLTSIEFNEQFWPHCNEFQ